ncbi:hypothetical protein WUBG_09846, partial [Wuchereria bancrofti]
MEANDNLIINRKDTSNLVEKLSALTDEIISDVQPGALEKIKKSKGEVDNQNFLFDYQGDMQMSELTSKDISKGDDDQSRLSDNIKEKLHTLAGNMRCRTSQMADEIMRESDDEEKCSENIEIATRNEHRPSLMSLVGLQ